MNEKHTKENLKEQLNWTKEQISILDKMNQKLHEMKEIAEYAAKHKLSSLEREQLNVKLNELKNEYDALLKQYNRVLD